MIALLYIHLLAATAWIGGSIFMFALGVTLRDKQKQEAVYPVIGPIFGYFEVASLVILLISGILMAMDDGLLKLVFEGNQSHVVDLLRTKLWFVLIIVIASILHFSIALKTNDKKRTKLEHMLSRSSSMLIFILNLVVLYYAIRLIMAL